MAEISLHSLLGISTSFGTFQARNFIVHPSGSLVYSTGKLLIIHNPETGEQRIFPGHTQTITTVAVSPCGKYVASGQDTDGAGQSCIFLWTYESGESVVLEAFPSGVRFIDFSPDSHFLAACSLTCGLVACWSCDDYTVIGRFTAKDASCNTFVAFGQIAPDEVKKPRPSMNFVSVDYNKIYSHLLVFNRATLTYEMTTSTIAMPTTGTVRTFTTGIVSGDFCFCGTPSGELCVFNLKTSTLRTILKYFKCSVTSILLLQESRTYPVVAECYALSSSDGDVIVIYGQDMLFNVVSDLSMESSSITCLSHCIAGACLYAIVGSGAVFRFELERAMLQGDLAREKYDSVYLNKRGNVGELPGQQGFNNFGPQDRKFTVTPLPKSDAPPTSANLIVGFSLGQRSLVFSFPTLPLVVSCSLVVGGQEYLVGATQSGTVQVWHLLGLGSAATRGNPTSLIATMQVSSASTAATAICTLEDTIYVGFSNGSIAALKMVPAAGEGFMLRKLFDIPNAHRAAVSALDVNSQFLASGGADGGIFTYSPSSGAYLAKITGNFCHIFSVKCDILVPTILHASFSEGYIHTYDLKNAAQPKRLKNRQLPGGSNGFAYSISQVPVGRYELACACVDGLLRFFDFDVDAPVQAIALPSSVFVNHKGRYMIDCNDKVLISAGCETEGDEVIMSLVCGADDWIPADTQFCNGVNGASVWLSKLGSQVVLTGFSGEVAVYDITLQAASETQ